MTKAEIVDAAVVLFSERGYEATNMRDIALRVGIKAASLYSHIENKQEILYIIIDSASDRFVEIVERHAESTGSAEERLRAIVRDRIRPMVEQLDVATIFLHEGRSLNPAQHAGVIAKRHLYEEAVTRVIAAGVEDGSLETPDCKLATTKLLTILNWTYTWYRSDGPKGPDEISEFIAEFAIRGLRSPSGAGTESLAESHGRPSS